MPEGLAVAAPAPAGFDREWAAQRTRLHLSELISIDTANGRAPVAGDSRPDGNELAAARWFAEHLAALDGVELHVLDAGDGRGNFVARLRAPAPTQRPVLMLGHLDVVDAQAELWTTPPFVPTERDGYLYGRGAIDCKGPLAAELTAFEFLAKQRERLTRDVILLATAAEEGGPSVGIDWMLEHHAALFADAEFALNEGGRVRRDGARVTSVNVQTTEKVYYEVLVEATGSGGHGSVPLPDNALAALARAVARLHEWRAPARLNETTRLFFARSAESEPDPELAAAMRELTSAPAGSAPFEAAAARLAQEPIHNAILRSAASLTMIDGGHAPNVIPSTGRAVFNLRVLPDADVPALVAEMQRAAGEPSVQVRLDGEPSAAPTPSPVGTALFAALESSALAMAPDAAVLPFMSTGATDGAALRAAGIPTYGILPIPLELADELRMHGDDERAPLDGMGWAAEYITRVLLAVATEG